MASNDYLVEMSFPPFASLLSPQELLRFTERMALPTLEALERLAASGRIVAGGPVLAAIGFTFIARAESAQELEDMVAGLPLWPRSQTRIVPLGTFSRRTEATRGMTRRLKELAQDPQEQAAGRALP